MTDNRMNIETKEISVKDIKSKFEAKAKDKTIDIDERPRKSSLAAVKDGTDKHNQPNGGAEGNITDEKSSVSSIIKQFQKKIDSSQNVKIPQPTTNVSERKVDTVKNDKQFLINVVDEKLGWVDKHQHQNLDQDAEHDEAIKQQIFHKEPNPQKNQRETTESERLNEETQHREEETEAQNVEKIAESQRSDEKIDERAKFQKEQNELDDIAKEVIKSEEEAVLSNRALKFDKDEQIRRSHEQLKTEEEENDEMIENIYEGDDHQPRLEKEELVSNNQDRIIFNKESDETPTKQSSATYKKQNLFELNTIQKSSSISKEQEQKYPSVVSDGNSLQKFEKPRIQVAKEGNKGQVSKEERIRMDNSNEEDEQYNKENTPLTKSRIEYKADSQGNIEPMKSNHLSTSFNSIDLGESNIRRLEEKAEQASNLHSNTINLEDPIPLSLKEGPKDNDDDGVTCCQCRLEILNRLKSCLLGLISLKPKKKTYSEFTE